MNPATLAAFAEDRARQLACRAEYALNPLVSHNHVSGPCITGCGERSQHVSGLCTNCQKGRP